jgi:DNA-binding LytR/AlgR family response regulator
MRDLTCLIVDDEPLALDLVENFLERLEIRKVTRCQNSFEALQCLQREPYDLLILDIEMPRQNGIDLLKSLKDRPAVVITTAYRDYAVEGFELEVLDYLLKPFSFNRFSRAIEKVPEREEGFHFLNADRQLIKVQYKQITYIESRKDYIQVRTTRGQWLLRQSLSDITASLPPDQFFRIHRSYTVALGKIEWHKSDAVHIDGKALPVSRENRAELKRRLLVYKNRPLGA